MKNEYRIENEKAVIFLKRKNGDVLETVVDTSEIQKLMEYDLNWYAALEPKNNTFYAQAWNNGTTLFLHRVITNAPKGKVVDHINHDTLDNRLSNLRLITHAENIQNRKSHQIDSKSKVRGVHWVERDKCWKVQANFQKTKIHLGQFKDLEHAKKVISEFRRLFMPYSAEFDGTNTEITLEKAKEFAKKTRGGYRRSSTGYKFVVFHKLTGKYTAAPYHNKKIHHLGLYETPEKANKAVQNFLNDQKSG